MPPHLFLDFVSLCLNPVVAVRWDSVRAPQTDGVQHAVPAQPIASDTHQDVNAKMIPIRLPVGTCIIMGQIRIILLVCTTNGGGLVAGVVAALVSQQR